MRVDNYALSAQTKQLHNAAQANPPDSAGSEAARLICKQRQVLTKMSAELLEHKTLTRTDLETILREIAPDSESTPTVGVVVQVGDTKAS